MTDLKLDYCKTCNRLEPVIALTNGECCLCRKENCAKARHGFYLVALAIAAAISSVGLIFCLIG